MAHTAQPFSVARDVGAVRQDIENALTVDVEDYFHASALASVAPRSQWQTLESRVERNTHKTLELFADAGAKGTFFILGCVAERFPGLVRDIADGGHEVASHGFWHYRVGEQTPDVFLQDVSRTKSLLEDLSGQQVIGYRAANFSIDETTWWAFDKLSEAGYRYSSSVNPVVHDHYGVPNAPRFPFIPSGNLIIELPLTTAIVAGRRVSAAGGGYFRLLPYSLSRLAMRRVNRQDRQPIHFYFHPWEIDPGQPRLGAKGRSRFRHYVNLGVMEAKLRRLLGDFRWSRTDHVYRALLNASPLSEVCGTWPHTSNSGEALRPKGSSL